MTLQGFGDFAGVKEARLSSVKELATSRLDWERLFRELAHVLPENVWLTGFDAQAADTEAAGAGGELGPKATLKGCADSHSRIADAMIRLRELHVAEDVELTQTTAGEEEEAGGTGAPAAPAATDSACGKYYSFEVAVTMATPVTVVDARGLGACSGAPRRWGMNISQRDKKIVMIIVPLVVVLGYWFLLLAPKREAAADAAKTLATEQARLSEAQSHASTVQTAKTNFARDYAAVVALGKAIPTSVDMPSLLVQLEEAARGTGIEFDGVSVGERASIAEAAPAPATSESGAATAPSGEPAQSAPGAAVRRGAAGGRYRECSSASRRRRRVGYGPDRSRGRERWSALPRPEARSSRSRSSSTSAAASSSLPTSSTG